MYNTQDTIVAISSGSLPGVRHLLRLSGEEAINAVGTLVDTDLDFSHRCVVRCLVNIDGMQIDAVIYIFPHRNSYTGDLLVELSVFCSLATAQSILENLISEKVRLASPGEFTARAYLNGKIDLSGAEAVAEIVSSSNKFQLEAAQKLLEGKLSRIVAQIGEELIGLMSLLEAELDFCEEETLFITPEQASLKIDAILKSLKSLIDGSIRYETMIALPSVGFVGVPNSGKSSLLNALSGDNRSIVSSQIATTRDILTAQISLADSDCVMFDCAGLSVGNVVDILDGIAQQAAIEAINSATLAIFCISVDSLDFLEDMRILSLLRVQNILYVATKCDKLKPSDLSQKISLMNEMLPGPVLVTSSKNGIGLESLRENINDILVSRGLKLGGDEQLAVNKRHKLATIYAVECAQNARKELLDANNELASIYLRDAYETLANLDQDKSVDEQMLERIFSDFCIGK